MSDKTSRAILTILLLLMVGAGSAAVYNCTSCEECTAKIQNVSAGDTVYLIASIINHSGSCIEVENVSGVTFDCQEYLIIGDDTGLEKGIYFQNSSNNTITNCKVSLFWRGIILLFSNNNVIQNNVNRIFLSSSNNNIVINNTASNTASNGYSGISIYKSENNTIIHNTVNSNKYGISIDNSDHNSIINNTGNDNAFSGIFLWYSDNNKITNNTVNSNSIGWQAQGIRLEYSNNNTITNNNANSNAVGINLRDSKTNLITQNTLTSHTMHGISLYSSDSNIVTQNIAHLNPSGVYFYESNNNILTQNTISNSSQGIFISYSYNNSFYHNNLIDNSPRNNSQRDHCSNSWDNGVEGNYWSDYSGLDLDNDGIGDTPYNISGGDNQDNYPLMEPLNKCSLKGDYYPCDETVSGPELLIYINLWVRGGVSDSDLLDAIDNWAMG